MAQNNKKFWQSRFISQEPCIIWLSFMVQMCKAIISPSVFFNFKILIFQVVRGIKGQKMTQNNKKFCPSRSIFQEPYLIWFSFVVHMCKTIMSLGAFFHFFNILIFQVVQGWGMGEGRESAKNGPKWQKILSATRFMSQEPYIIWFSFMVRMCKAIITPDGFFHFFDILIFRFVRAIKVQKMVQNYKKFY